MVIDEIQPLNTVDQPGLPPSLGLTHSRTIQFRA